MGDGPLSNNFAVMAGQSYLDLRQLCLGNIAQLNLLDRDRLSCGHIEGPCWKFL